MNDDLILKAESLKNMLLSHATGGGCDAGEYVKLRRELLSVARISEKLPRFVHTCRSPDEFWGFIKYKFGHYHERREFIRHEFDPILSMLESESRSPNDGNVSAALDRVNSGYVQEAWRKALERRATDPEGAITAARTLLESVCKHILDETGTPYKDTEELPKLYSLVASQLNLSPSQHAELHESLYRVSLPWLCNEVRSQVRKLRPSLGRNCFCTPQLRGRETAVARSLPRRVTSSAL
jgi:hypothetical protein